MGATVIATIATPNGSGAVVVLLALSRAQAIGNTP